MDLTSQLPCWASILIGLAMIAAGVAWRFHTDRRQRKQPKQRDFMQDETGLHRSSYLLVMGGVVWTGFSIFNCLS